MQIPNVPTPNEVEKGPPSLFLNNEPITVKLARASRGGDFSALNRSTQRLKCFLRPQKCFRWFYIDRFHCHAINTAQKNKLETVQWKKPRKWNVLKDSWYINNLSKSQVYEVHSFWVFCWNVSCTIVELCRETPHFVQFWSTINVATGNQQTHLELTFSIKALSFHLKASIRGHKHIFQYLTWLNCWKSRGKAFFIKVAC